MELSSAGACGGGTASAKALSQTGTQGGLRAQSTPPKTIVCGPCGLTLVLDEPAAQTCGLLASR